MTEQNANWKKYSADELKALYEQDVKAGKTRLTQNEWTAKFLMEQTKAKAPSESDIIAARKPKGGQKDKPREKPAKKSKASGGKKAKKKSDAAPIEDSKPAPEAIPPEPQPSAHDDKTKLTSGLTAKQEMFVREYITDFNATRAAIAAGYSKKTASSIGHENLSKPEIQGFMKSLLRPKMEKLEVTAERILKEYENMAFANLADYLRKDEDGNVKTFDGLPSPEFDGVTRDQMAGLAGIEVVILPSFNEDEPNPIKVKMKLADKKAALDVLAKRHGVLKEVEPPSVNVNLNMNPDDLARRVAFMLQKASKNKAAPPDSKADK